MPRARCRPPPTSGARYASRVPPRCWEPAPPRVQVRWRGGSAAVPRDPHAWLYQVSDVPHGGGTPGDAPGGDAAIAGSGRAMGRAGGAAAAADNTLLDLSASIAPLGPSPLAVAAAHAAPIDRYPSRRAGALVRVVAAELGVDESRVVAGPGAADLLLRVALAHLRPGYTALLVAPCFGEYARAALACGARVVTWSAPSGDGFRLDVDAIATVARRADAAVGFLARPANPTAVAVP